MIELLELTSFRCIARVQLQLQPGLSFFFGQNGAGKTSLLEAVHVLSSGRSFRGGRAEDWLRRGSSAWSVAVVRADGSRWAVHWSGGRSAAAAADGEAVSLPMRARGLPVLCLHPDLQRSFFGERETRRRVLDWVMFHVEPVFAGCFSEYGRCLRQRNEVLRREGSDEALKPWTELCVRSGLELHRHRERLLPQLQEAFNLESAALTGQRLRLRLGLHPGWPELHLQEALDAAQATDRRMRATTVGPHRADLRLQPEGRRSGLDLSRGEAKAAVYALALACWRLAVVRRGAVGTLLLDDMGAELDPGFQDALYRRLNELGTQVLATGVHQVPCPHPWQRPWQSFHVEHGVITAVS